MCDPGPALTSSAPGSMQSHNLQYAPARYVLHFFQIFKEQTPANDITTMSIEKSAMKTRPAGHHHDLLLACTALCYLQWWSWSGSNRRPTACKAAALPAELQPLFFVSCLELPKQTKKILVGLVGFEPTTPALSRRCSNRLSYRPAWPGTFASGTAERLWVRAGLGRRLLSLERR